MALAEKTVPLAPVPEPLALPKDIPELPEDVLKRFPTFKGWYDELTGQWWRKVRTQFYESQDTIASSTNDQVNKTNSDIKVIIDSTTGGFYAALLLEQIARTNADGALASSISTVIASYTAADATLTASIVTEQTARVTADSALATSITTVTTNYLAADAVIAASVTTEATARSSADGALASSISTVIANYTSADTTLQNNINTATASIASEATARATADSAEATSRTAADATLTTNLGTTNANVTSEIAARVSGDSALAGSITTVIANYTAADATISASVTTEATARAAADGALYAQWGVKLDISGHVVGYIHLDGTSSSSTFTVAVDKFVVTNANGTITALDIRTGGVMVFGSDVQSDNYDGTNGWLLTRAGNLYAATGTFKGTVTSATINTSTINGGTLTIDDNGAVRIAASTFQNFAGTTEGIGMELAYYRTVAGDTWIDFHTAAVTTDYEARLIRTSGTNGDFSLSNTGSGNLIINAGGGGGRIQLAGGLIQIMQAYNVGTPAVTGYFAVKDLGGTTRLLLCA